MKLRWLLPLALALALGSLAGVATARVAPESAAGSADASADAVTMAWLQSLPVPNYPADAEAFRPVRPDRTAQGTGTTMIDDFEQQDVDLDVFKGWLLVEDLNGSVSGDYYWGVSECRSAAGSRSAWAIGNGADGADLECGSLYPNDAKSSASLRLDLSGWPTDVDQLDLVFDFWLNTRTEIEDGVVPDGLFINYMYPSGRGDELVERVTIKAVTAKLPDRFWDVPIRIDLSDVREIYEPHREFNLVGKSDVDIEFLFVSRRDSGGEVHEDGCFIDQVRLEWSEPFDPNMPTITPSPTPMIGTPVPTSTGPTPVPDTPTPTMEATLTPTDETPLPDTPTPTDETPMPDTPTPTDETPSTPTPTPTDEATLTPTPTEEPEGFTIYLPIVLNRYTFGGPMPTAEPTEEPGPTAPVEPTDGPVPTDEPTPDVTEPAPESRTFMLLEENDSGVSGTAQLTEQGADLLVEISLTGTMTDTVYPVHVRMGTCADIGDVVMPLNDAEDGASVTLLDDTSIADFTYEPHAICAKAEDDPETPVACGDIPDSNPPVQCPQPAPKCTPGPRPTACAGPGCPTPDPCPCDPNF